MILILFLDAEDGSQINCVEKGIAIYKNKLLK